VPTWQKFLTSLSGGDEYDNRYRISKKNGEVVGITQTGTEGWDMFDEIITVDLDKSLTYEPSVEYIAVTVVEAALPQNDESYIRLPGVLIINTWNRASGSAGEGLDLSDIIPAKGGAKLLAGGIIAGVLKKFCQEVSFSFWANSRWHSDSPGTNEG